MPAGSLPVERTSFVGRRTEINRVRQLLSGARLVTLVGPGGVGKTRLAIRVAGRMRHLAPAGVCFVDLALVRDPALLPQQLAASLDLRDSSTRWLVASIAEVLGTRRMLVVLDNCEHVRDACAILVDALLSECPNLRVLATSRRPLDVAGEVRFVVPPLPITASAERPSGALSDAIELLVDRARAVISDFEVTEANVADVTAMCRRLDGLPLALELAAVRLRTLTATQIVERLSERLDVLQHVGPAAPERQRSLPATLEWSYRNLRSAEQILWQRAAVFVGDFDLAAAEAVCADPTLPRDAIMDAVDGLVDASVLDVYRRPGRVRFRMLETVRLFGSQLLEHSGGRAAVARRHRDYYARLAAKVDWVGPAQVADLNGLAGEHGQLRAALEFSVDTRGEELAGLRLAADLWLYWQARGQLGEGRRWLARLLERCAEPTATRAKGLAVAGYLAAVQADPAAAIPLLQEAHAVAAALDEPGTAAFATQYLGLVELFSGNYDSADQLLRAAAADRRRLGEDRFAAFAMADVGAAAFFRGDYDTAGTAFTESISLNSGGDPWTRSHALWGLGLVRWRTGALGQADQLQKEALALMREVDDRSGIALGIHAMAWLAAAHGDWHRAAVLAGAAEATWRSIPARTPDPLRPFIDECAYQGRRALGAEKWQTEHDRGGTLDRPAALALALGQVPPQTAPRPDDGPLTPRQREVAQLVAQGLTDREVAGRLSISIRTAESHVEQILARLGFRSRAQIAAWVAATGDAKADTQLERRH
ncbi:MAG TPA: LuxR C-terminal-related transcriptional regulator [Jiangellaceae bacterium]|nr:LuxR C-terminal-related transcriptional regulator [Jiangellaceae bacterium]